MENFTPREIVSELDKHIVGQQAAKKSVAIALRNRWRRAQVGEPLRQEITPKNLLMIGPPGAGKSMLAARLPGLLPDLSPAEALEVSLVHSVAGMLEGAVSVQHTKN